MSVVLSELSKSSYINFHTFDLGGPPLEIFFSSYSVFKIEMLTENNIHSFSVYTSVSLSKCIYVCNDPHNYDVEHFHLPKKFPPFNTLLLESSNCFSWILLL